MDALDITFEIHDIWRPTACQLCLAKLPPRADPNDTGALFKSTVFSSNPVAVPATIVTGPILLSDLCGGDLNQPVCVYLWDSTKDELVGFVDASVRSLVDMSSVPARCRRCKFDSPPELPDSAPAAEQIVHALRGAVVVADNRKGVFTYTKTVIGSKLLDAIETQAWCRPRNYGDTSRNVALDVANFLVYDGCARHAYILSGGRGSV